MIDLQALRSLLAIDRHGSVVAAADVLGFSPSAVSQQIKKLERDLGTGLLERHGRGVLLTERGRVLVSEGAGLLGEIERITTLVESPAAAAGRLRIVAFSTATRGLLAPALRGWRAAEGSIRAQVRSVEPADGVRLVADGDADLAVVHNWNSIPLPIPAGLTAEVLGHDEADVILPAGHRLAGIPELDRRELIGEPWAATPGGAICNEALLRIFSDLGVVPDIVIEDPEFATLIEMARTENALALVPRLGRPPLPKGVVARPLAGHRQLRKVQVLHRSSMASSAAIAGFLPHLRTAFAEAMASAGTTSA